MLFLLEIVCPGLLKNIRYEIYCTNDQYSDVFIELKNNILEYRHQIFEDENFITERNYRFIVDTQNILKLIAPINFTKVDSRYFFYVNFEHVIYYFIKGYLRENNKFFITHIGTI